MPTPRKKRRRKKGTKRGIRRGSVAGSAATPLSVDALRWQCDPKRLSFDSTAEVEPISGVVGQDSAVAAMRFGLETNAPGQNVFVRGLTGTGRLTLVKRLLEEIRLICKETKDCCFVHNFAQPERPRLITFPPGLVGGFRRRMDRLIDFIRDDLAAALSSQGITSRRRVLEEMTRAKLEEVFRPFEHALRDAGLTLVTVEAGPVMQTAIFPLVDGKAVAPEEFDQLHASGSVTDEAFKRARDSFARFEGELRETNIKANEIRRKHDEAVSDLVGKAATAVLEDVVRAVRRDSDPPGVAEFLAEVVDDVIENRLDRLSEDTDFTRLYRVNVVLEHKGEGACPIIVETAPSVRNLLGTIDIDTESSEPDHPTHMGIRAGSLLRADGGYLILEDRDILSEPEAWKALKRALRDGRIQIAPPEPAFPGWGRSLKPEPIDIRVKVVMLGDPDTYHFLDANDREFPRLFKVLADFDTVIPRDDVGIQRYASVVSRIAAEEHLPPFDRTAIAALIEQGARIAARAGKLTARFGRLADVAREAAFIAEKKGEPEVGGDDVRLAVLRGKRRADLPSRRFLELVADGTIRVETTGVVVGQVNGLAVLQAGPMVYGFPTRLTATIGPGTAGVINIEREAALSGAIHTKGFQILGGLLRSLLRTDHPLAFDASIAFEQSYGRIDGDSASGAEICCLLSALTDIPLRQDLAMTGAIDQKGHILAVGAVNEKIEGFFEVCRDRGFTGQQGVIIPTSNAGDLMLRHDVVEACEAGDFRVFAVDAVHEALSLLTGMPAGVRAPDGTYGAKSVLGIALSRAREFWLKVAPPVNARGRTRARARKP